jgi:RNA polymerase sigma-70 factor (ECF subfamily)
MRGQWPAGLERPQAYLRRIAANLLKDRAKTARRRSAALHMVADEEVLPGFDPQRHLESRDMLMRLEAAMMRLRPRTREIFMAHRVHGESYAEIAERTGISVKGVEKQMAKALVQLDRILHRP